MAKEENKKKNVKYFELFTDYGPLYIYEKYNNEVLEVHEFFTHELAKKRYDSLEFFSGTCKFITYERTMDGIIINEYYKELSPYKFLKKVLPYLKDDNTISKKEEDVYETFKNKINNVPKFRANEKLKISKEQKNKEARRILKRYLK